MEKISKRTSTKNATIELINGEIFYVLYKPELLIEVSDFEETRSVYQKMSENGILKFLVEFPKYASATNEARKWAEDHQVDAVAEAIVFNGLAQRILIRFYMNFRKQNHPVRIFDSKENAIDWLSKF
jgi:hypothetical protein